MSLLVADPEGDLEVRTSTSFVIFCCTLRIEPSFDVVKEVTETFSFTCDITEKLFCKNRENVIFSPKVFKLFTKTASLTLFEIQLHCSCVHCSAQSYRIV